MPNFVAISQATTEINNSGIHPPPRALSVSNRPGQIGLSHFALMKFYKLEFAYTSSASKIARKVTKMKSRSLGI